MASSLPTWETVKCEGGLASAMAVLREETRVAGIAPNVSVTIPRSRREVIPVKIKASAPKKKANMKAKSQGNAPGKALAPIKYPSTNPNTRATRRQPGPAGKYFRPGRLSF